MKQAPAETNDSPDAIAAGPVTLTRHVAKFAYAANRLI